VGWQNPIVNLDMAVHSINASCTELLFVRVSVEGNRKKYTDTPLSRTGKWDTNVSLRVPFSGQVYVEIYLRSEFYDTKLAETKIDMKLISALDFPKGISLPIKVLKIASKYGKFTNCEVKLSFNRTVDEDESYAIEAKENLLNYGSTDLESGQLSKSNLVDNTSVLNAHSRTANRSDNFEYTTIRIGQLDETETSSSLSRTPMKPILRNYRNEENVDSPSAHKPSLDHTQLSPSENLAYPTVVLDEMADKALQSINDTLPTIAQNGDGKLDEFSGEILLRRCSVNEQKFSTKYLASAGNKLCWWESQEQFMLKAQPVEKVHFLQIKGITSDRDDSRIMTITYKDKDLKLKSVELTTSNREMWKKALHQKITQVRNRYKKA